MQREQTVSEEGGGFAVVGACENLLLGQKGLACVWGRDGVIALESRSCQMQ